MKIIVYSDLHLYNHHKLLINSETALSFLSYIKNFALKNNINTIISLGDFFHTKSRAYAPHVVQALLKIKDMYKENIMNYMLIGNHDMSNPSNTMNSILFTFSDYAKIIPDYIFVDEGDTRLHFLSYSNSRFDEYILSEDKKNVLFGHLDILGFTMSNGIECKSGYDPETLKEKFDLVISGHYHQFQVKNNIVYVGSSFQTNFGERNQSHGFIVLDTDTLIYEFVEYDKSPKYIVEEIKEINDIDKMNVNNSFLRLKLKNNKINKQKLKEKLIELGALSVEIIPPEEVKEIEKYYKDVLSDNPEEIAAAYLDNLKNLNGFDLHKLMKHFRKIEEVSNKISDYEIEEFGEE
jgi:DNA repair exonuclease SbcCD nuclease subunit